MTRRRTDRAHHARRRRPGRLAPQPLAEAALPAGDHLGLPDVVDRPGRDRRDLLVQLRAGRGARGRGSRCVGGTRTRSTRSGHDPALRSAMFQTLQALADHDAARGAARHAFAIGVDRWRGRPAAGANFSMLFSFVVPEIILGVSLFLLFTNLFQNVVPARDDRPAAWDSSRSRCPTRSSSCVRDSCPSGRSTKRQRWTWAPPRRQALRRVLFPLLWPAILASIALVFADSVDDFVTVRYLSAAANTEPLSVKIYSAARSSPTPAVNAAATVMLDVDHARDRRGMVPVPPLHPRPGPRGRRQLRTAARRLSVAGGVLRARSSSTTGVPVSGQDPQRLARQVNGDRRPEAYGTTPPSFWIHAWIRSPGASVTNTCRIEPT